VYELQMCMLPALGIEMKGSLDRDIDECIFFVCAASKTLEIIEIDLFCGFIYFKTRTRNVSGVCVGVMRGSHTNKERYNRTLMRVSR